MVLLRRGQKGVDHITTSLGVIREGPTECWQLYILTDRKKKKRKNPNHPYNSSPDLARKRVPIQEWGMCQLQQHQHEHRGPPRKWNWRGAGWGAGAEELAQRWEAATRCREAHGSPQVPGGGSVCL